MRSFSLALLVAVLALAASPAFAWVGDVVAVSDGDTLIVAREDGTREKVRLFGIDCPESAWKGRWEAQPFWRKAKGFVEDLFAGEGGRRVTIWERGKSYDRLVAGVIILDDGAILQERIVAAGYAWVDPVYCKKSVDRECGNWMELEQQAARERRGLWRALDWKEKPVAPWKWRKGER